MWLSEWVITELGPAANCVLRLPPVPLCIETPGEDNTLHVLFLNSLLWPSVLQSWHLIRSLVCTAVVRVADPPLGRALRFSFGRYNLRLGWIWQLILLSQDAFWSHGVKNEACFFLFTFQYDCVNVSMVFRAQGSFLSWCRRWIRCVFVPRYRTWHCTHRFVRS